ncbi:GGDEF domain-containing protein [Alicyclobacillus mengziensis]|uniref:GGDEF domain-containing protein n=1 Tax=Alicyclobacillus mengziensis TaxID=2931921 RepID=A0A9X7W0H3_9BACL|nr:GGDEF domain-containing protein [Alicyclobacillus mengziensis]QSO48369.1 GGDEF domain-containing protein [Alicyclobacillus mengziensis]
MYSLKTLIEQSRDWASAERGRDLFAKVAYVLQQTFAIESGMFIYCKQFIAEGEESSVKVYNPWGIEYSESELTHFIGDGAWFSDKAYFVTETWLPFDEAPSVWKRVWFDAGIQYVGAWKLVVKGLAVGAIVLGQKNEPDKIDSEMMAASATHVSLVLEMLISRRIAEHASLHDPLTNVLNRRGFELEFTRLQNQHGGALIVGMLDLNEFKNINDSMGHLEGDAILVDVAQTLQTYIAEKGVVARFGGDEFVFAMRTDNADVATLSQQVRELFTHKQYTASVGCTVAMKDESLNLCLHAADERLYEGKLKAKALE